MTLRRILVGNRKFRVRRVVGVRTAVLLDIVRELQYLLFGRRSYDSRPDGESGGGGPFELLGGIGSDDGGDGGGEGE